MPRALAVLRSRSTVAQRDAMLARFRQCRTIARHSDVNYWVYSDDAEPITWVEFVEAPDASRLRAALRQLETSGPDDPILTEVELD